MKLTEMIDDDICCASERIACMCCQKIMCPEHNSEIVWALGELIDMWDYFCSDECCKEYHAIFDEIPN